MLFSSSEQPGFASRTGRRQSFVRISRLAAFTLVLLLIISSGLPTQAAVNSNLAAASPAPPDPNSQNKQFRYFETTGHSLSGPLLRYYTRTGGETRHGQPISEPLRYKDHYQQYFERSILEFYPEYAGSGQEVRLAPLGHWVASEANLSFGPVTPFVGTAEKWYFPESGHSLSEPFLSYWRNSGEETTLGFPISEELGETAAGGSKMTVQYFENVKLQRTGDGTVTISNLGTLRAQQQLKPAQLAAIPRARFEAPRTLKIPSLMFHYARKVDEKKDPLGYGLSVTPENYVKFLDWVQVNGYNTVTVSQVLDYFKYGILLPDKPVIFRWDDGHDNNWFVYQEMKKRGMTATFYVISQRLELTPAQWKQIDEDGFEVTAHTRTHPDLRGVRDLAAEITGSKADIERMLGHPVRTFAYPYGKYSDTIKRVVRDSGFELAVTTNGGYNWSADTMLEQPVLSVIGSDNLYSFSLKVANAYGLPPAQVPAK
jgi:peptidoglycan/xylan/chitin deacetylase (PgdA/CDA1 family)